MPWPIPAPGDISDRAAATYESVPALAGIDARNDNTVATTNCRITEMAMQDLYFYQGNVALEMMPDTAVDNLPRFAAIYDIPQDQPSAAGGNVIVTGVAGEPVPINTVVSYAGSNTVYLSTAAVNIGSGGTASIPVVAEVAGSAGNLAPGTQMTVTSPVAALTTQAAVVDSNGITGGADLEDPEDWRARILAEIREEPSGGNTDDYVKWAKEALPNVALAACPEGACGGGVVSVVIAMTGLIPPTTEQLAAVQAYIDSKRPVTADVTVYGITLNPVNVTLHLNPDTTATRAAASAALALSFVQDAAIGGTTYVTRLDAAVSNSDGEYSHEMSVPAADVAAPSLFALNILGTVSFI
jgi:uncharacterized phage protein gp47/JayE